MGSLPGGAEGLNFWTTPASVTQIDKAFYTSGKMNDAGAVAGIFSGLEIYQNGQVQAITLPSPFAAPSIVAINDADQVLVSAPASSGTGYTYGVYSPRSKTCAADITRQLEVIPGPITLNTTTGRYTQSIRVENATSVSYPGPTSLGFIGLPPTVSLLAPSGATLCSDTPQGTAFVTSSLALGPVSQIYFQVQYINPESTPICLHAVGAGRYGAAVSGRPELSERLDIKRSGPIAFQFAPPAVLYPTVGPRDRGLGSTSNFWNRRAIDSCRNDLRLPP